jgi:hypothetical protein
MADISIEQAVYHRTQDEPPRLRAHSPGFAESLRADVENLLERFGPRPNGIVCPQAIFAQPLGDERVAIVRFGDLPSTAGGPPIAAFHVLVLARKAYRDWLGDPFAISDRFPVSFAETGSLPGLSMPAQSLPAPTIADVRQVLKQVKAGALAEDQDPQTVELTVDNAESPALLGGVQVLVDGGKLVFLRPAPDAGLVRGLWTLLPRTTRRELWPASFAFSNALRFDVVVVPRRGEEDYSNYTTEDQAADYPAGQYELSLQTAAESGDQRALDALFMRRSTRDTLRLAIVLAVLFSVVVAILQLWPPSEPREPEPAPAAVWSPEQRERAANAAAVTAAGDPLRALTLLEFGQYRRLERAVTAASIVVSPDPLTAAMQTRAAHARYVEIWKPVE